MRKEILSSVCTLSLVLGASSAFAGAYGDVEQPEEIPAPPPAVAVVEPEPETDYARTGPYIGVGGLYAIEFFSQGDPFNNGDKTAGDASNSAGFHVAAGYRVIPNLAVEARYEYYNEFDTDPDRRITARTSGGGYNGWSTTVNAKGYILTGQWQPYALIGLGYLSTDGRRTNNAATAKPGDGFAMRFGVGMDACIGEHWALGPELAYLLPFGDAGNMDMLTIGGGVRYKF